MKKLFLQSGKLWYNEFPEEPVPYGVGDEQYYGARMDDYNAAVSAAKDSAVEIVNPEAIIIYEPTGMVLEGVAMYGDDLYDLPKGWTEEIYRQDETGPGDDQYAATKARLIPLKEQSSGIKYMHDRECRRYRDEGVLCQDHCYFKTSGIKECPPKSSGIAAIGKAHIDDGTKLGKWVKITSMKRYPGSPFFCKVMDVDGITHEQVPLIKVKIKTIIPDENPSGTVATGVPEYWDIPSLSLNAHTSQQPCKLEKYYPVTSSGITDNDLPHPHHSAPTIATFKREAGVPESGEKPDAGIPQWIIDYDAKNFTSSAGEAIRILITMLKESVSPPPKAESQELVKMRIILRRARKYVSEGADMLAHSEAVDTKAEFEQCVKDIDEVLTRRP